MPKFSYDGSPFEFSPWKKTSGKENLGGAVGSPRPEAEARPNRRCWDYAAIHTWFLVLSWTLAGWRDLTTDRFPGECIGRKSAIWEIWVGEIWSLSLPDYFQLFFPLHSFAIVSLRIPDFRWSNLFNFGSYTQTVYEAATSFGWSRLTALRQGTDTHTIHAHISKYHDFLLAVWKKPGHICLTHRHTPVSLWYCI